MLGLVIVAALGGCDWVLSLKAYSPDAPLPIDAAPDAPLFPDCFGKIDFTPINAAVEFPGLSTVFVPQLRADLNEVLEVEGPPYEIVRWHRSSSTFVRDAIPQSFNALGQVNDDPALTADGLLHRVHLRSRRAELWLPGLATDRRRCLGEP